MAEPSLILHHYASSPFSEKVRLAMGLKGIAWASVEIAAVPPRPLLTPLTGGYRRVPVMQTGADIYCDTNIILPELDRRYPKPTLHPAAAPAFDQALSFNWERSIWIAAIGVRTHFADPAPDTFLRDRKEDYLYVDIGKAAMEPTFALNLQRVKAQLAFVAAALADGRRFLGGDRPGALDLGYYHPIWLMRGGATREAVDAALDLAPLVSWIERVASLGHGRPTRISAETALAVAKAAMPIDRATGGEQVTVTPDDFARVPVSGALVRADDERIVIRRDDPDAGIIHLHFPRVGFTLEPA